MQSLLDMQSHKKELLQQRDKAVYEGNLIKRDCINREIFKADKLIESWGTKSNTTYRIM